MVTLAVFLKLYLITGEVLLALCLVRRDGYVVVEFKHAHKRGVAAVANLALFAITTWPFAFVRMW
jgi:hypothetical protein